MATEQSTTTAPHCYAPLIAYLLTVAAFVSTSLIPEGRFWGFSVWAHFPVWVPTVSGVLLLLWGGALWRTTTADNSWTWRTYSLTAAVSGLVLFICFILFRTQTHYMGDGYALLDHLASNEPLIKNRQWLESWVRVVARDLAGGASAENALTSFRVVAWIGGAIFVLLAAFWSRRLLKQPVQSILLFTGIVTGGYMLMFFGYVENYSLFVPAVVWFVLYGLAVAQGRNRPWWSLISIIPLAALHIFGVTLLPAAVYLILSHAPISQRLMRIPALVRWSAGVVVVGGLLALLAYFWQSDQFFRYAFVPLAADRVTVEGYTMFSMAHLLDMLSLLFVLLPGLLVLLVALVKARPGWSHRDVRFGVIVILSCIGAAFIFDPKLGMPRDWDLFAFCGVPMAAALYYLVLKYGTLRLYHAAASCAIALGLLVLVGRVATQQSNEIAAARFEQYTALDSKKNMNFRKLVVDYYESSGDMKRAAEALQAFHEAYPEWNLNRRGMYFMDQNNPPAAIPLYRRAIEENPVFTAAYSNLAIAYLRQGMLDSAETMANIARGFNPLGPRIAVTLGQVALQRDQVDLAEQYFEEALSRVPDDVDPIIGLAMVARMRDDEQAYAEQMVKTLRFDEVPVAPLRGFANFLASRGQYAAAVRVYEKAMASGMDTAIYRSLLQSTPQLKRAADSLSGN